jgi:hypothetical protein
MGVEVISVTETTSIMSYVLCPKCGDAVGGPMPQTQQRLRVTCFNPNCKHSFVVDEEHVRNGTVSYDPATHRLQEFFLGRLEK